MRLNTGLFFLLNLLISALVTGHVLLKQNENRSHHLDFLVAAAQAQLSSPKRMIQTVLPKHTRILSNDQFIQLIQDDRLRKQVTLLDARNAYPKYYWSHVLEAQHSPWRRFTQSWRSGLLKDLKSLTDIVQALGIEAQRPVIIYGDWNQGWGEEARMLWLLEYLGHSQVFVLEGGWQGLDSKAVPKTWGRASKVKYSAWQPIVQIQYRAETKQVETFIKQGMLSLDARSKREFDGATPYGSAYGGHLPYSVHLPIQSLFENDGRFKSASELKLLFTSLGAQPEQALFTYCTGGIRSAFVYLALREAGFKQPMNYDGSWWAWTASHPQDQ